jgi:hypothetical protein
VCSGGCGVRGSDLLRLEADRGTRSEKCAADRITPSVKKVETKSRQFGQMGP